MLAGWRQLKRIGAEADMELLGYVLGAWGATLGACMFYALYLMMRGRKLAGSVAPNRRRWLSAAEEESKLNSKSLRRPLKETVEMSVNESTNEVEMPVNKPTSGSDMPVDELLGQVEAASGSSE